MKQHKLRELQEFCQKYENAVNELYEKAVPQQLCGYWKAPEEEDFTIYPESTAEEADLILENS